MGNEERKQRRHHERLLLPPRPEASDGRKSRSSMMKPKKLSSKKKTKKKMSSSKMIQVDKEEQEKLSSSSNDDTTNDDYGDQVTNYDKIVQDLCHSIEDATKSNDAEEGNDTCLSFPSVLWEEEEDENIEEFMFDSKVSKMNQTFTVGCRAKATTTRISSGGGIGLKRCRKIFSQLDLLDEEVVVTTRKASISDNDDDDDIFLCRSSSCASSPKSCAIAVDFD